MLPKAGPRRIGDVVSELMAQTGFAQVQAAKTMDHVWREAVGEATVRYTRPGRVRRGVLEVGVASSTIVQELVFQKAELLTSIRRLLPDTPIRDLRFHVVPIDET
jgi:predicted nucleic acid-binding Zn ribbon protein